ncbi:hypothetical protein [Streptomyces albogriseolus]|uniref:hypothetical protein n=1 Tax=Streptomyces albogriseolus TaxID=1887 RepID=UPI003D7564E9
MDSTETARRLLGHGAVSRPYAQLTGGHVANTPIYAELVAEWRAKGHTVPGHRDGLWASFAVMTANDHGPAPTVPFRVPVPLLAPETSEEVPGGTPEEEPGALPSQEQSGVVSFGGTSGEQSGVVSFGGTSGEQSGVVSFGETSEETPGAMPSGETSEGMPSREPSEATSDAAASEEAPEPGLTSSPDPPAPR